MCMRGAASGKNLEVSEVWKSPRELGNIFILENWEPRDAFYRKNKRQALKLGHREDRLKDMVKQADDS